MAYFSGVNTYSYWERDLLTQPVDVAIIGGGFVGSFAGLFLARMRPDLQISIYDKNLSQGGASSRNAGFACFGSLSEILATVQDHSMDEVKAIIKKRYLGLRLMQETLGVNYIGYRSCGGYEVFGVDDAATYGRCCDILHELNDYCATAMGIKSTYQLTTNRLTTLGLNTFEQAIFNQYEGSIHPGMALARLHNLCRVAGVQLIGHAAISNLSEGSTGMDFDVNEIHTCSAKKVILSTNGFTRELIGDKVDLRPARNMVLVTHPIPDLKLNSTFHFNKGYVYFRNVDNRVLLGGGRHIDKDNEHTSELGFNPKIKEYLTQFLLNKILPGYGEDIIDTWWPGIMGIGDKLEPEISWLDQHILAGVRLNGMGVALSSLVGQELADKMSSCF